MANEEGIPDPVRETSLEETRKLPPASMKDLRQAAASDPTRALRRWVPPLAEEVQRALPQYEVTGFIARGGMGVVYKGVQKALKRTVAIKILPAEIVDDDLDYVGRFKREAQAMAALSHPNIVTVYEAGETPEGLLYFTMEYIDGTDVGELVAEQGRLPQEEALRITSAVLAALECAHGRGIIHRDVKPSNVLINKQGEVKVADFGLAKVAAADGGLTQSVVTVGTPDFLAPETYVAGFALDQRADIYSAGVMLYKMLTGRVPRGRFDAPSGEVRGIDPRLDRIIDKAMQEDREKRYATAREMRSDVEDALSKPMSKTTASVLHGHMSSPAPAVRGNEGLWIVVTGLAAVAAGFFVWWSQSGGTSQIDGANATPPATSSLQWKRAFADLSKLPNLAEFTDGWARLSGNDGIRHIDDHEGKPLTLHNGGLRVKRRVPADWHGGVLLHVRSVEGGRRLNLCYYEPRAPGELAHLQLRDYRPETLPPNATAVQAWDAQKLLAELLIPPIGTEIATELMVVGTTLLGRVGDHTITCTVEDQGKPGRMAIDEANTQFFRDVEIINLDGLSETAALKFAGIGRDAGKATVAASLTSDKAGKRNAPVAGASATRWHDAFAESPLREVIAKAGRTSQGYRLPDNHHWTICPLSHGDGALRVRATSSGGKFVSLYIALDDRTVERVRFRGGDNKWLLSRGPMGPDEVDFAARSGSSPCDGRPHELLIARISGRIRTMLDGQLLHDEADESAMPGRFVLDIYPGAEIVAEKVEYLNLDGVPEDEALRLLGIQKD